MAKQASCTETPVAATPEEESSIVKENSSSNSGAKSSSSEMDPSHAAYTSDSSSTASEDDSDNAVKNFTKPKSGESPRRTKKSQNSVHHYTAEVPVVSGQPLSQFLLITEEAAWMNMLSRLTLVAHGRLASEELDPLESDILALINTHLPTATTTVAAHQNHHENASSTQEERDCNSTTSRPAPPSSEDTSTRQAASWRSQNTIDGSSSSSPTKCTTTPLISVSDPHKPHVDTHEQVVAVCKEPSSNTEAENRTTRDTKQHIRQDRLKLPRHLQELIARKRMLLQQWQRLRVRKLKTELNHVTSQLKDEMRIYRGEPPLRPTKHNQIQHASPL